MSERETYRRKALERLEWMHKAENMTLTEIAAKLDTHPSVVSRWYNGKGIPSYNTSKRILSLAEAVAAANPKPRLAA